MNTLHSRRQFLGYGAALAAGIVAASTLDGGIANAAPKQTPIGSLWSPTLGTINVFEGIHDPRSPRKNPRTDMLVKESSLSVKGAVHMPSPLPGTLGNAVVAGHRTSGSHPFRFLDRLPVGETITYTDVAGLVVEYVVQELAVLSDKPADYQASFARVMANDVRYGADTRLTLYACTRAPRSGRPWSTSTPGDVLDARPTSTMYRLAVFAAKV